MENKKLILEQRITKLVTQSLVEKYNNGEIDEASLTSHLAGIKGIAGNVANKFVDKAKQLKQGLADTGREIKDTVNYIGNDIKTSAQNAVKSAGSAINKTGEKIGNHIQQNSAEYKKIVLANERKETERAFETFAKSLNKYNTDARQNGAEPLSIQGMLNRYRRTYPNLFKEAEEPILNSEPICESKENKNPFEKTDVKKDNKLKKKLGLEDNEKLTISRVNSELKHLKAKYKEGEKMSKEDLTFEKELNLAKTLLSNKK